MIILVEKVYRKLQATQMLFGKYFMKINHKYFAYSNYTPKKINQYRNNSSLEKFVLSHIATFSRWNAGDIILPLCVKDSFNIIWNAISWNSFQITYPYTKKHIDLINKTSGLIIGGGGIFIKKRNNSFHPSSWHWNCTKELANQIKVPIFFFAVGYNQFRGQDELSDKFKEHLASFSKQIEFIGMRNHGSCKEIKTYLSLDLHSKIYFQPCPTTIIKALYPRLFENIKRNKKKIIGINCAFDRIKLRYGNQFDVICNNIALAIQELSYEYNITYILHSTGDKIFLSFLNKLGVKYTIRNFIDKTPKFIINKYKRMDIVIGMRGHSQMIPFGCGIPILSLISHNKLKYFLDDINHNEWGIEILESDLTEQIVNKTNSILDDSVNLKKEIDKIQADLFCITKRNVNRVLGILGKKTK